MSDENSKHNRLYRCPFPLCASQRPERSGRAGAVVEHATMRNRKDARKSLLSAN